jgi:Zn-dependent protease
MELLFFLIALVIGLTLHEFAHAWMSNYLGDETAKNDGRLSINPIVHIDPFTTLLLPILLYFANLPVFAAAKPVPFNPWAVRYGKWGAALVAVAGPLMNVLIAVIFALTLNLFTLPDTVAILFRVIVILNIFLFVFNMLPIPPLDGSRVLYAAAPPALRDVMDQIERYGLVVIFILILVASPIIIPFISAIAGFITSILLPSAPGLSI